MYYNARQDRGSSHGNHPDRAVERTRIRRLEKLSKATGKSRSEIVREAIRNETFRARLTALRAKLVPRARAAGWLTEDDIFRDVS